ncbi:MAG: nucleotide kinase [Wendovervirus sonii]|uniref:Nucleotide kinase n=1 Tax=phage Lak_Megaphage_Sonny TaxID=3109229 RepID=A0ABZ0Z3X4_9CAUD|nr:MAG: nucleotide kinase [phage Lak_Megaphage_Sonny]
MTEQEVQKILNNTLNEHTIKSLKQSIYNKIDIAEENINNCSSLYKMTSYLYDMIHLYKNLSLLDCNQQASIDGYIKKYKEMLYNIRMCIQYLDDEIIKETTEYSYSTSIKNVVDEQSSKSDGEQSVNLYTVKNCDNITISGDTYTEKCITIDNSSTSISVNNNYEFVNQPAHYNMYDMPVIDMMEKIWGPEDAIKWCKMTAWKYRQRMGTKPGESVKKDLDKEKWYLDKAAEIEKRISSKI